MNKKLATIRGAYNKETWALIGEYVNENGWLHTDHVHDPVSIHSPQYRTLKEYPKGYSCGVYVRPSELRESLIEFKKGFRNEKYYRKLSKKERRQFRNNCKSIGGFRTMKYVMTIKMDRFSDFIGGFFTWTQTPEGLNYWSKIFHRYDPK